MHIDPYIVLGSAVIGFLVGMTGAGGGALMTPMLILLFGVTPSAAISSDLVAAVLMRPFGAAVHLRRGTVNLSLVRWMVLGSVPMAFVGAYILHLMGHAKSAQHNIEVVLGIALLIGAGAMVLRYALDRRTGEGRTGMVHDVVPRPLPTIVIGMIGGVVVGITSVGSGSLMIIMLLFLYPMIGAKQLVGTDLTQAVPLTVAAALGALAFGHVQFGVTVSLIIGSVPAVLVGSMLSSSAPDRYIRPVITFVIAASGLKYVGVGTTAIGWILCGALLAAAATWLVYIRPRQSAAGEAVAKAASAEIRAGGPTPSAEPAPTESLAAAGAEPAPGESLLGPYSA
ncbi:MAG TPA: sulfite exporter TauE/SafE family protein [Solirubrobacteraceae bacterium]